MPYIDPERRKYFVNDIQIIQSPGELNYILTLIIDEYMRKHDLSYQTINDIVGALDSCKLEFYRRVAVPYEEKKLKENGDVYCNLFT